MVVRRREAIDRHRDRFAADPFDERDADVAIRTVLMDGEHAR